MSSSGQDNPLQAAKAELAALTKAFDSLTTPIALVDAEMRLRYCNAAMTRVSSNQPPELLSGFLSDPYGFSQYLPQISRNAHYVLRGVTLRKPWRPYEVHLHRLPQSGHLYVAELQRRHDETVSFEAKEQEMLVQHAQRNLERVQHELEKANLDLQQFAYVASHDLQAPLRGIEGFLKLLIRTQSDELSAQSLDLINHALDNSRYMQQLIIDLLRLSRLTTDEQVHRPVPLVAVLQEIESGISGQLAALGGVLEVSDDLPVVGGDRDQLKLLFSELLHNAIEYRSDRPLKISVSAASQNERWLIDISDNGVGIDKSQQEAVFELFRRIGGKRNPGATGIGLSLCSRIVANHRANIWLSSTPGVGSTFTISLPCLPDTGAE